MQVTEEKTKQTSKGYTVLGWIVGGIFLFTGFVELFSTPILSFFILLAGLSVFPPFWKLVQKKWNISLTRGHKVTLFVVLIIIGSILNGQTKIQSNTATSNTTATQASSETTAATETPTPTDEPTATLGPTLSPQQIIAKFQNEGQHVTVTDIYKSPNSYKGKSLIFTCSVSSFPKDENGDVGGLNCTDPNTFGSNVQVGIGKGTDVTKINENDIIKVYGLGLGAEKGKNAFGGDITTGAILGLYINDLTTGYKNY